MYLASSLRRLQGRRHPGHRRGPAACNFDLRSLWFGPQQDALFGTKDAKGKATEEQILPVAFVPLTADDGSKEA